VNAKGFSFSWVCGVGGVGAGVGVFDSPITRTNNHKMDTSKLK